MGLPGGHIGRDHDRDELAHGVDQYHGATQPHQHQEGAHKDTQEEHVAASAMLPGETFTFRQSVANNPERSRDQAFHHQKQPANHAGEPDHEGHGRDVKRQQDPRREQRPDQKQHHGRQAVQQGVHERAGARGHAGQQVSNFPQELGIRSRPDRGGLQPFRPQQSKIPALCKVIYFQIFFYSTLHLLCLHCLARKTTFLRSSAIFQIAGFSS